jgi:hypothetical protein
MKEMARSLARKYASRLSSEKLLVLARHDTWLKSGRGGCPYSKYPGEKTQRIAEGLLCYLQSELRVLVDTFWKGRTSVELVIKDSSAELEGFFNGKRPGRGATGGPQNGLNNDADSRQAPYV